MTARTILERAGAVVLAVVVLSLLLGQLFGQPILLGYVATGSMEPTMDAGDGFVAVPSAVAGEVGTGDVVVFDATHLHDGGLTTHRVVAETDEGYVTHGDANPFTDQDGGEPPVTDGQIVAVALQVNGEVVTIPHLGTAIMGVQSGVETAVGSVTGAAGTTAQLEGDNVGALLVGVGVALLGFGALLDRSGAATRHPRRPDSRRNVLAFRTVLVAVLLVLVTLATAAMVVPSGVHEYGLVATASPTEDPQVVAPGETTELEHAIDNAGFVPVVAVLEPASGATAVATERVAVGSRATGGTTVTLTAPEESGETVHHVEESRYLLVLPPSVLAWLHGLHPLVAIGAVNAVLVGAITGVVAALFGTGDLRLRSAGSHVPRSVRLERKLRRWR
ncbi:S26 family signal peptidase [Natrononativus amylolyticus]|uniref:S26 family signal peptidase n=1 Tax=Natrononativus amylolyticus TaxID=2963434 RepID=UPI0020CE36B2|nr:S26 family signal peptidase [Natrononativus amylolyticus]